MFPNLRYLLRTHALRRWLRITLKHASARAADARPVVVERGFPGCERPCLELEIAGQTYHVCEAEDSRHAAGLCVAARMILEDLSR